MLLLYSHCDKRSPSTDPDARFLMLCGFWYRAAAQWRTPAEATPQGHATRNPTRLGRRQPRYAIAMHDACPIAVCAFLRLVRWSQVGMQLPWLKFDANRGMPAHSRPHCRSKAEK